MFTSAELSKLVSEYIEVHCAIRRRLSVRTVGNKRDTFRNLLTWLKDRPLDEQSLQEYVDEMDKRMTPNSRNTNLRYIRTFVKYLYEVKEVIDKDWGYKVEYAKERKKKYDIVKPEIMEQIIIEGCRPGPGDNSINRVIKKEMQLAMRFMLRTGCRFNETSHIAGKDLILDSDPPMFWVTGKGGNQEMAPLPKDMVEVLRERVGFGRVFRITDQTCNRAIKRGMEILGIVGKALTCHSCRHIFAISLLLQGVSLQQVSRLLRHKDIKVTDACYSQYDKSDLSLILNSKQALVRTAISPAEVVDEYENMIKRYGIDKDIRFKQKLNRESNKLVIELTWQASVA